MRFWGVYKVFSGFGFFCSQAESTPTHLPGTQTVGSLAIVIKAAVISAGVSGGTLIQTNGRSFS
jgi:hypothetical protein